ncbi:MAG: hypothetical protein IJX88_02610 [Clostridia bacterium]|nr:hypothetical protein [Clostridia bacterium]
MNKLLTKTVKKFTLISVIMAVVLAAAIVIAAIFGVNYAATIDDSKSVTVTMSSYLYRNETELNAVKTACEAEFDKQGLKVAFEQDGTMGGDECEIVYFFDKKADVSKAVASLKTTFATKTAAGAAWDGFEITVASATETLPVKIAAANYVRAAVAVAFFAVLALIYVALRYRWHLGCLAAIGIAVSSLMTAALVVLTRFPFTQSVLYAIVVSALLTAIFVLASLNKLRAAMKEETDKDTETLVVESVATKEILGMTISLGVALILVGAIATASTRWFALASLISLVVSAGVSLFFVPALCVPLTVKANERAAKNAKGYKGAKATKEKTEAPVAQTPVTETNEAPVEQTPVEETPVETAAEEPVEEAAEEIPVEETVVEEAPVEKTEESNE